MPKRTDIHSILVIGAGPIIIGQACEFDYSGSQACKVLRDEGYRVILVNSNPATIMTDPDFADVTYIEPLTSASLIEIIEKERPDAILPTMGGQTALNCVLTLSELGFLEKYNVQLLAANLQVIENAENRETFKRIISELGLQSPKSEFANSMQEARALLNKFKLPVVIRPSFTLGGSGGGIATTEQAYFDLCQSGLTASPIQQIMVDESLIGWKEYELEVVRDSANNCIIVCSIENLDPMGVHTGDSITVAPALTLTDKEYQKMRQAAFAILRAIGLETGGANVQFAVNPNSGEMVVIEMNPRVSRSSALASKATGFPIAKIATQLAIGYTLPELQNTTIGGGFPASFEPTLDYVVVKMPRFNFDKFPEHDQELSTYMQSVGEVMAIGRSFQESLQKAILSLDAGYTGLDSQHHRVLPEQLSKPTPARLWHIADALRSGWSIEHIHSLTLIDPWFLDQIKQLVDFEKILSLENLTPELLLDCKRKGFSDSYLAKILKTQVENIYQLRDKFNIKPSFKKIDTCAAEFACASQYYYSCYEFYDEVQTSDRAKVMVLGSGPNRIGQGIEFDYSCVHALQAIKAAGYEAIMVNCNPETVSTDYDAVDRLYFEPVSPEYIQAIVEREQPIGIIVQTGGQTALSIAKKLPHLPLLGTSLEMINLAEDRAQFSCVLQELGLNQAPHVTVENAETKEPSLALKFPIIARPSHIIGGASMAILNNPAELAAYFNQVQHNAVFPILFEEFLAGAIEYDVDAIADGETFTICGIFEHIEPVGVHSGDSASIFPAPISQTLHQQIEKIVAALIKKLNVVGFINIQLAIKDQQIFIIEVNPRASRTIPFLAKATQIPWARLGSLCMLGKKLKDCLPKIENVKKVFVKESVFPFNKLNPHGKGSGVTLGPSMKSTGEVMGSGANLNQAFQKAQLATGMHWYNTPGNYVILNQFDASNENLIEVAAKLKMLNLNIFTRAAIKTTLAKANIASEIITADQIQQAFKNKQIAFVVHIGNNNNQDELSSAVTTHMLAQKIYYTTTLQELTLFINSLHGSPTLQRS